MCKVVSELDGSPFMDLVADLGSTLNSKPNDLVGDLGSTLQPLRGASASIQEVGP